MPYREEHLPIPVAEGHHVFLSFNWGESMFSQEDVFDDFRFQRELEARERYIIKRTRTRQVSLAISLLGAGLFYISANRSPDLFLGLVPLPNSIAFSASLLFLFCAAGLFIYFYVQGEPFISGYRQSFNYVSNVGVPEDFDARIQVLEEQGKALCEQIQSMGPISNQQLVIEAVETIKKKARDEIWKELESSASESAEIDRKLSPIQRAYESTRSRLLEEVESLGRRGAVNLVCGVLTTLGALGILLTLALDSVNKETYQALSHDGRFDSVALALLVIPKLSLALFVQIFSLFFLRLYRSGLAEIKYFQNELTNVEVKYLGLISAVVSLEEDAVNEASKKLLDIERNHVLSKGQTTVELEKHKIEHQSTSELVKLLPSILGKK